MNHKTITKIILDISMTVLYLILLYPKNTGLAFHEIFGLGIGGLFIFHILLNWPWVKSISRNLFNPKLKPRPRMLYILNVVSFISVAIIIVTGIQISQVLFPSPGAGINHNLFIVHKWVSYLCLGLFGIHIALHRHFISEAMLKLFTALRSSKAGKAVMGLGTIVLVVALLYSQIFANVTNDADQVKTGKESSGYVGKANPSQSGTSSDSTISTESGTVYEYPTDTGQDTSISTGTDASGNKVTLSEYLGKMFCNGCPNHCSLLNLQCNKGIQQLEAAKTEYQQQYGSTSAN